MERCAQDHREAAKLKDGVTEMHPQPPSQEIWDEMTADDGLRCKECGPKVEKKMLTDCQPLQERWLGKNWKDLH